MFNGVSIIICTYNGANRLKKTLDNIRNIIFDFPFELLIINNNSTDNTIDIVNQNLFYSKIDWRIINEFKPGLSFARWRGINCSKYDIILFCDDDNYLSKDYLKIGFELFNSKNTIGIIGGLGFPIFESEKPKWFDKFSHSYAVGSLGKDIGIQEKLSFHYGAACFFLKKPLLELQNKGFKSILKDREGNSLSSGGDVELCYAVQFLGYKLFYSDELKFGHYIEKKRLTWDYYIELKKGITISFPLLYIYEKNYYKSKFLFKLFLLKIIFFLIASFLKNCLKKLFIYNKSLDFDLSLIILKTKIIYFFKNYTKTVKQFNINKKNDIFNNHTLL